MKVIPGPDFPTAGYIYGRTGIREAYTTGRGIITLRAKAHVEKMRGGREAIIVTELPYQVNKATLMEKIGELIRDKKIEGISEHARRVGPRGHPRRASSWAGRDPADRPQPALQAHRDADHLRRDHAGPGRPAAAGA